MTGNKQMFGKARTRMQTPDLYPGKQHVLWSYWQVARLIRMAAATGKAQNEKVEASSFETASKQGQRLFATPVEGSTG
jgi:hypothetical protein